MKIVRFVKCLWIFLGVACAAPAGATSVPHSIPAEIIVSGHRLVLNGYGERERWLMDVYNCALYLPQKSSSIDFIKSPATPSVIRVRVNIDPPTEAPDRWEETFREELSEELFRRMTNVYEKLEAGDVVLFAYAPGHGTKAFRNGRLLFTDPGHGLMDGLLDQWLGPRPVSKNLRRLLLR